MDINDYSIFNDNIETLRETSHDSELNEYMTDSLIEAINFDGVKTQFANSFGCSEEVATSVDALILKNGNALFIEFKNAQIGKSTKTNIKRKISDSLLIFNDITDKSLSYTRKYADFILVYSEEKNSSSSPQKGEIQASMSREKIKDYFFKKSETEFIRFGLEPCKKVYFRNVHTYTQEEFRMYLKNSDLL